MKLTYIKPAMSIVNIHLRIICTSDWDKIGPGKNNQPAGARQFRAWEN